MGDWLAPHDGGDVCTNIVATNELPSIGRKHRQNQLPFL
jgi:hypothetical protein